MQVIFTQCDITLRF